MITVAIAVRDSAATRQYRELMSDTGVDAHFATDIPTLIRLVKGRPIDVVIFDLARNALSINSWLLEVSRDRDLSLAPVLWVGSGILPEMRRVVEEYRPGMYLPQMPSVEDLKLAINRLIGRVPPVVSDKPRQTREPSDEPVWTPGEGNIDEALRIFAENGRERIGGGPRQEAPRPKETIPFPPSSGRNPVVRESPRTTPTAVTTERSSRLSEQELDAVAERVSRHLAEDLMRRLDRDELRRAVERALAEAPLQTR